MGRFVQGIASLFGGGGSGASAAAQQQAALQREQQAVDTANASTRASAQAGGTAAQLADLKQPRGRRLLLSGEDKGLATTLGGAT